LLKLDILLGDLAEWMVENGHVVLETKADIGVLVERLLPCRVDIGRLQGNRLVAVLTGELDPAVPFAVLDISPAEDHQTGLQLLRVDEEAHGNATSVQNL